MNEPCNIGPENQRKRERIGMALIIIAGLLSGFFIATRVPSLTRILVFPLFAGGFITLMEAKSKVCVWYAYRKKIGKK